MKPFVYAVVLLGLVFSGLTIGQVNMSTLSFSSSSSSDQVSFEELSNEVAILDKEAQKLLVDTNNEITKLRLQRVEIHLNFARFHIRNGVKHLAKRETQYARFILDLPPRERQPGVYAAN